MLVRLLQQFSTIELQPDANPAATPSPGSMKSNLLSNGKERIIFDMNLTANVKVSMTPASIRLLQKLIVAPCSMDCG